MKKLFILLTILLLGFSGVHYVYGAGEITTLTELAEKPAVGDLIEIVDVSDTTYAASGTNKKLTYSNLLLGTTPKTQVFNQCTTVKGLVATDDFPVAIFPYAITITGVRVYHIGSTDVQGQFDECTGAGGVCTSLTAVDADIDASSASVWTADDGSLTNPSIAANNGIWWHTTSVTGTNTFATMCFYYTVD